MSSYKMVHRLCLSGLERLAFSFSLLKSRGVPESCLSHDNVERDLTRYSKRGLAVWVTGGLIRIQRFPESPPKCMRMQRYGHSALQSASQAHACSVCTGTLLPLRGFSQDHVTACTGVGGAVLTLHR